MNVCVSQNHKILIIAGSSQSLIGFRGDLIRSWIREGYEVYATAPDDSVASQLKEWGIKDFISIPVNRTGSNPLSDLCYLSKLWKAMRAIRPDITLGYTIKPVIYGAIAAKLAGVKNINSMITGAGFIFASKSLKAKILGGIARLLYRFGLASADKVIFQNKDDLQEFVNNKLVRSHKCHLVNGSGVSMEQFSPASFPEKISFLMVSRLLYSKGTIEYFEAAKKVKELFPEVQCLMLGSIDNKADCIPLSKIQSYFDSGVIKYLGTSNDVSSIIAQSSVFVLPSYREGVPISTLEAMAMGRPILTTDAPGCRETVIEGENGFLVPSKNIDALAEKMIWFIEHQDKISTMGESSLALCAKRFEVSKINLRMNKLLHIIPSSVN